jgi:hypothetical protein
MSFRVRPSSYKVLIMKLGISSTIETRTKQMSISKTLKEDNCQLRILLSTKPSLQYYNYKLRKTKLETTVNY